jgi:hypothetical protein
MANEDGTGVDLSKRSMQELRRIRDSKQKLLQKLEEEKRRLEEPSDLEIRVTMLEGAVELADKGDELDEEVKQDFLRRFVEDLRDDHHHHHFVSDHGRQATRLHTGDVVLNVREHPMLTEDRVRAEDEARMRKMPSAMERHPALGVPGMGRNYRLVPNPWNEQGYDYRREAGFEQSVWHDAQDNIQSMVDFDDAVAQAFDESSIGQAYYDLKAGIIDAIPVPIKEAFATEEKKPLPYGCGDVFVNRDMAKVTGRNMRLQMAQVGLQVYGEAPAVTNEWLEENRVMGGKKKYEEDEPEKGSFVPSPDAAIMRTLASPDYFAPDGLPRYMTR